MARRSAGVLGNWYGELVHNPSRGLINVSFKRDDEVLEGEWNLPRITRGPGRTGAFKGVRFAHWLDLQITTKPLRNVRFQVTLLQHKSGESMITGVIPLEGEAIPFMTVTLFRHKPAEEEFQGICPILDFRRGRENAS
jgi:hypothetical protein